MIKVEPTIEELLIRAISGSTLGQRLDAWAAMHARKGQFTRLQNMSFEHREAALRDELAAAGTARHDGIEYKIGKGGLITLGLPT